MFQFKLNLLLDTPPITGVGSGTEPVGELSKDDILDSLNDDSKDKDDPETLELGKDNKRGKKESDSTDKDTSTPKEDKEEEDEEESLEDELEKELKEPTEDELELTDVQHTRKEILKEFPELFKKFPGLEAAYYRERKYSEILPTLQDAQQAVEKSQLLDSYGKDLTDGSLQSILRDVKQANGDAFNSIADNYLEDLFKVDKDAYYHVIGNNVKAVIEHAVTTAKSKGDDNLREAARILYEFTFGTDKWVAPQKLGKAVEKNQKEEELNRREREIEERRVSEHISTLDTKISNSLKSTIDKFIDPTEDMSAYTRTKAIQDVQDELENVMKNDSRFMNILQRMHERAIQDNFSDESAESIKSAMFSKAKVLLPVIIKKIRREALHGQGKKVQTEEKDRKGPLPVGQTRRSTTPTNSAKTNTDKAKALPRNMTSLEFLNQD